MCNIAGYVGTEQAAPILIEMMRREEGWGGGYYTGIATLHEGRIHYAKLTGDTDRLVRETEAASLPGTVGIIHSRSKSGGGDAWAHPFAAGRNGKVTAAYVANGSYGCFADRTDEAGGIADRLFRAGYDFSSKEQGKVGKYPMIQEGWCAHISDVMAQLIASKIDAGQDAALAMADAFCEMPSEIVGLLLTLTEPECIVFSRVNQPMMLGFAPHGAYLATTSLAFPADAGDPILLPACSGGKVYASRFECAPYENPPVRVAAMDAGVVSRAFQLAEQALQERFMSAGDIGRTCKPTFEEADCCPSVMLGYHILQALENAGRLEYEHSRVPGAREGLDAPLLRARIRG